MHVPRTRPRGSHPQDLLRRPTQPTLRRLPAAAVERLAGGDVDKETAGITGPHSDFAMATPTFATPTLDRQR
ncbi:hypothetical protein DIPPA_21665 [Diplonema papillatum]|nr:hypothetical protein DIPPA_30411 [Diplonema papillatum]KAJ9441593.1 hypothetical protein DIPPA_21665 [Diplonema papillatum]